MPHRPALRRSERRRRLVRRRRQHFLGDTNANLDTGANAGSGLAHFVRADTTGVTAIYGWRNDALGTAVPVACRVFGFAVSG